MKRTSALIFILLAAGPHLHAQFRNDSSTHTITIPDFFPAPFITSHAKRVTLPFITGKPEADVFEGKAVFFNPAEASPASRISKTGGEAIIHPFNLAFFRWYQPVADWPLSVHPERRFYVKVEAPEPAAAELERYFRPFWFKKCEVTNAEYREFVNAVKDSIIRQALAKQDARYADPEFPISFTLRELDSLIPGLMLHPDYRIFGRIEFDVSKFIYRYADEKGVVQEVPVYPDTLVWLRDFYYSYGESMTKHYYSHPAFNNYPAAGVNFFQAKAYCHWLTGRLQQQWNGRYGYTVAAGLPFEYEREYVITGFSDRLYDDSWITSLYAVSDAKHERGYNMYPNLHTLLKPQSKTALHYGPALGSWKTHQADVEQVLKKSGRKRKTVYTPDELAYLRHQVDRNGISGLADNLSEWMSESFTAHWQPLYEKRKALVSAVKTGSITTLDSMTAADFYLQYLPLTKSGLVTTPELFKGVIFHAMNERRVDSLALKTLVDFSKLRQYISQPDTSRSKKRSDAAYERQAAGSGNPFQVLETGILENILYYKKEMPLLRGIEDYFYGLNDADGQLVRGGNWYDASGMYAKTFVSPHKCSSMIGFRYVIRLVPLSP